MKIPSKLKIGGHWFEVVFKNEVNDNYDKSGSGHAWNNKITIQKDMMQSKKESTFLHEIVHEINWQLGLNLDEHQTDCLGESMYQVLVDNNFLR